MRNRFDQELDALHQELIEMGALIETAIATAIEALIRKDAVKAQAAIDSDPEIDEKERYIERHCLRLLLQQQPVASDLRRISTALKMITDMERIGDHATDISEITLRLYEQQYATNLDHISQMAHSANLMVQSSIDAFVRKDLQLAQKVISDDDIVDDLFNQVKSDLINQIHRDVSTGEQAVDFLMVAKYLERIGDHAVNLSEWVIFSLTGQHKNERIL
jgi:phosphate transport system protein